MVELVETVIDQREVSAELGHSASAVGAGRIIGGIAAVIGSWARRNDPAMTDERALVAYSFNEAAVEAERPSLLYQQVLAEAFRRTGDTHGFAVTAAEADALGSSVVAWPAFTDSADALARLTSVWINRRHDVLGWGATPETDGEVAPAWEFSSMAAFADAVDEAWALR